MVVALLYAMQSPCNCFTLSLSSSDSRSNNSCRDDNGATMEIKVSRDTSPMYLQFLIVPCYYITHFGCLWALLYTFISFLGLTY